MWKNHVRDTLEMMKGTLTLGMIPIQQRTYANYSDNAVWHSDTARKWIKYKLIVSRILDEHSRKVAWSKYLNRNMAKNTCVLVLKAVRENVTLLQVRGNMGLENKLWANYVKLLWNTSHNSHMGGRSSHDTRFDDFWGSTAQRLKNIKK